YVTAGTPEQIADLIEDWFRDGAADGFNLMPRPCCLQCWRRSSPRWCRCCRSAGCSVPAMRVRPSGRITDWCDRTYGCRAEKPSEFSHKLQYLHRSGEHVADAAFGAD